MGFWDNLGESVGKAIKDQVDTYNITTENSRKKSDKRLIKDFKDESNYAKKIAMANELKKRGYGNQD